VIRNKNVVIPIYEISTLINICFVVTVKPYIEREDHWFELFNETINILFIMGLQGIVNIMPESEQELFAWPCVALFCIYFLVHFSY
jgi:hypothetical protein